MGHLDMRPGNDRAFIEVCLKIFEYLKQNSDMCIILLSENGDVNFVNRLLDLAKAQCMVQYVEKYPNASHSQLDYFYSFVSSGCIGMLRQWEAHNFSDSPAHVAIMAEYMITGATKILEISMEIPGENGGTDIQRYCKTKIKALPIPSLNDVASTKADMIFKKLGQMIEAEDLSSYITMIEKRVNEEDYSAMDIAAAFLRMAMKDGTDVEEAVETDEFGDTGAEEGMVRLFINVGRQQRVRPGDILGAIAGETGIPGKLIGTIDMYDKYTFVEVPSEHAKDVLRAMKRAKIKGKSINIEPANGGR